MTASTNSRATNLRGDHTIARTLPPLPVAAGTRIFQGTLVAITLLGFLVPAAADPTLRVLGMATEEADNRTGSAGDKTCRVKRAVVGLANSSGTGAVSDLDVGRFCYAVDDQTVSRTNPLGQYPIAGRVYEVDGSEVFVEVGAHPDQQPGSCDLYIVAGADLSGTGQNRFVALDSSGAIVLAATAGQVALGVLINAPESGAIAIVRRRGLVRMLFEGAVAEGVSIAVAATTGRAKTAVAATANTSTGVITGSHVMGLTLEESSGAGDLALVDLHPSGALPGTLA